MFQTTNVGDLRKQLDRFTIPMFIAQPDDDQKDFIILAINKTHETQTGMKMANVSGRRLGDILSAKEANATGLRYARCIADTPQLRYRELLHLPGGAMIWDTTLHHLVLPDGTDRILGGAVLIERLTRDEKDQLAFEDLRYFAANSSCTLSKIASVFEAFENGRLDTDQFTQSATVLAGLCRTVESTLEELRAIADDRLASDATPGLHLIRPLPIGGAVDEVELAIASLLKIAADIDLEDALSRSHGRTEIDPVREIRGS